MNGMEVQSNFKHGFRLISGTGEIKQQIPHYVPY